MLNKLDALFYNKTIGCLEFSYTSNIFNVINVKKIALCVLLAQNLLNAKLVSYPREERGKSFRKIKVQITDFLYKCK